MVTCPVGDNPPATWCSPLASISGPKFRLIQHSEAEVLVERTVPMAPHRRSPGLLPGVLPEHAQLLTFSISAFPTPIPWWPGWTQTQKMWAALSRTPTSM